MPFVERSGSGIRMFKSEDMDWLAIIECLKKTGMPIKEIKQFVDWCMQGDSTIRQRIELINSRRNEVLRQMEQLKKTLEMLDYKQWYYETAKKAGTCTVHDNLKPEDIPEKFRRFRKKDGAEK